MKSVLIGILFFGLVACQPSIYGTWRLTDVKMQMIDSVAIADFLNSGSITYTFGRNGNYSYQFEGDLGGGTSEIISKKPPMQLKTEEDGLCETFAFEATRNRLILRDKDDEMTFERIKKEK